VFAVTVVVARGLVAVETGVFGKLVARGALARAADVANGVSTEAPGVPGEDTCVAGSGAIVPAVLTPCACIVPEASDRRAGCGFGKIKFKSFASSTMLIVRRDASSWDISDATTGTVSNTNTHKSSMIPQRESFSIK